MGGPEPTPAPGRSLRQAAYLTAGMGIVHAVLLLLSFWILRSIPGPGAAEATLNAFYGGADRRRVLAVGLYLLPFAAIAFVWFIVALRMWVGSHGRPEQALFSNVQLVSGILFIALLLEAAAAFSIDAAVVEFSDGSLSPALARQFPQLGRVLGLVLAMRLAAMFVIATSSIGRHTRVLPAWFVWLGYVVGAFLLLAATLSAVLIVVFPVWVLALCVLLLVRARHIPRDATSTRRRDLETSAGAPRWSLAESQRREGERAALERQRIARDLHDSVSQSLFSTTLHVRTAQRALEVEQHDARVHGELVGLGQGVSASTVWPNTLPCGSSPI